MKKHPMYLEYQELLNGNKPQLFAELNYLSIKYLLQPIIHRDNTNQSIFDFHVMKFFRFSCQNMGCIVDFNLLDNLYPNTPLVNIILKKEGISVNLIMKHLFKAVTLTYLGRKYDDYVDINMFTNSNDTNFSVLYEPFLDIQDIHRITNSTNNINKLIRFPSLTNKINQLKPSDIDDLLTQDFKYIFVQNPDNNLINIQYSMKFTEILHRNIINRIERESIFTYLKETYFPPMNIEAFKPKISQEMLNHN